MHITKLAAAMAVCAFSASNAVASGPPYNGVPKQAKKVQMSMVGYFGKCVGGNANHAGLIGLLAGAIVGPPTSCDPPAHPSSLFFGPKGKMDARLGVKGSAAAGNEDITVQVKGIDILDGPNPYTGDLGGTAGIRITDRANGPHPAFAPGGPVAGATATATVKDIPFPVPAPGACVAGKCQLKTTVNTIASGAVLSGENATIAIGYTAPPGAEGPLTIVSGPQATDGGGQQAFVSGLYVP